MTVVTRFAPSPTGFLHIGGARTALFCWLYAKRHHGTFLLRIEDTDRERSTQAATDAILEGLRWLGLEWDGEVVHQFARTPRHAEVANELLAKGAAYHCYTSQAELAALREAGKPYDRRWREAKETPPEGVKPVIRLKAPLEGEVIVQDHVRGDVRVPAGQLEDLIILRSDGTPTYNLAVVVDDHDMGVTHIIRGEDHLTNAAKQAIIYERMGWKVPEFAHIPLIHGADGAKLSKRHGALGVEAYRDMGYLPEALRNYLLRLGWSHGDSEIISTEQAIEWFNLEAIGKSASRFDFVKLDSLNAHYIREADDARLVRDILPFLKKNYPEEMKLIISDGYMIEPSSGDMLMRGMPALKQRAKNLKELADSALFYVVDHIAAILYTHPTSRAVLEQGGRETLVQLMPEMERQNDWHADSLHAFCKAWCEKNAKKLGTIAQPLRVALTGSTVSPPIFEVMEVLGKEKTLMRIANAL